MKTSCSADAGMLSVDLAGIPSELKGLPQWVIWRFVSRDGKPTKIPFSAKTGKQASSTNPETWATFNEAVTAYSGNPGAWSGVGFVFAEGGGVIGIDLDGVLNSDGSFREWPKDFLAGCSGKVPSPAEIVGSLGTYCEVSPSGTGVKLFARGLLPAGGNRKGNKDAGVEFYDSGRYFTVTGHAVAGAPLTLAECNGRLTSLHQAIFGQGKAQPLLPPETSPSVAVAAMLDSDRELLDAAMEARNGEKVRRLWNGDTHGYASPSEADLALAGLLAFWTGRNPGRLESLMRQSGLKRPKWDTHKTYLPETVAKAIDSQTQFYGEANPNQGTRQRGWSVTILKSDPPAYKLSSPFYDGRLTLTARQYLSFDQIRVQAMEQKRVWLPGSLAKAWRGSKDEAALGAELLENATEEEAPPELDRGQTIQERVRDWAARQTRTKPLNEIAIQDLPTKDDSGAVLFTFGQLIDALNSRASAEDRVKRPELVDVLRTMGASDVDLGRGNSKRKVKHLPACQVEAGSPLRHVGDV